MFARRVSFLFYRAFRFGVWTCIISCFFIKWSRLEKGCCVTRYDVRQGDNLNAALLNLLLTNGTSWGGKQGARRAAGGGVEKIVEIAFLITS